MLPHSNPYRECNVDVLRLLLKHGSDAQNERGMAGLCEHTLKLDGWGQTSFDLDLFKCAVAYVEEKGRGERDNTLSVLCAVCCMLYAVWYCILIQVLLSFFLPLGTTVAWGAIRSLQTSSV